MNHEHTCIGVYIYICFLYTHKWYLLWGQKSINNAYFGVLGAPGVLGASGHEVAVRVVEKR